MSSAKKILITGGAGFIGSHVVRRFVTKYPSYHIVNLDALTYAGNLDNLSDISGERNYTFIRGDIRDAKFIDQLFKDGGFSAVIHLAAESHVDRSIDMPNAFAETNVMGTLNLLNAARSYWTSNTEDHLFYHISTDEVYGSLGESGFFKETSAYHPNSPYSASKAASDHFVRAFGETYGLNYIISNCSNNYGPNQFPEKLIPLFINNIINQKELPVYGDGNNTRDWLYVVDHADAIDTIFHFAERNQTFNVGGNNEFRNIELVRLLCDLMDRKLEREPGNSQRLIRFVKDRPGHDFRYAIDANKLETKLNWRPGVNFKEGLSLTIDWYLKNTEWLKNVTSGAYLKFYTEMYEDRIKNQSV
ncbi:dTDP-glucose 4,6-dehydratase [Croceivirga thetidis]|uniref:dTDP-glucose 4,6-dehydratase n=1 Tax=Croceivirga thetidis TaxID=2721623 RepID=A0ABX1GMR4_9FLAO|nr:dTDP-glucose 4,6-dehydratase [Croceivirga thetidis]NKI31208.1 dTDP-glucose 4,6-dehydratase [Croceivirga thetidis]